MVSAVFQKARETAEEGWEETCVRAEGDGPGRSSLPVPRAPRQSSGWWLPREAEHKRQGKTLQSPPRASALAFPVTPDRGCSD